jgi:hypothetical protein
VDMRWIIPALLKLILQKSGPKSRIAIPKFDDFAAPADRVGSHNISRNLNLLRRKSVQLHHKRKCPNILSIWIQYSKTIETRLFAVLVSTCSVSTSTSTTSTGSRPINFNSRIVHKRTRFVLARILV